MPFPKDCPRDISAAVKPGASSDRKITWLRRRARAGFSVPEVLIAMVLITLMSAGIFAGLQLVTRAALTSAIRTEAHRLLQAEAEKLLAVGYTNFVASADQPITSSVRTSFGRDKSNQFDYPAPLPKEQAVKFTRRVVLVSSTASSRTLRVEVEWTWLGKKAVISTPLLRTT